MGCSGSSSGMAAAKLNEVFVARQPVFDRKLDVLGYELLYRSGDTATAGPINGNQATSQVILNAFMEIGLETLVGDRRAFINITKGFLERGLANGLPTEQVVLEVLEDVRPTRVVIDALRELKAKGYTIALDDFVYREELQPLVDLAEIVKVDVLAIGMDQLEAHVEHLRPNPCKLLAEKVETQAEYERCRDLGFDYFQGYFFSRPAIVKGKRLPANRLAILQLLTRLHDPNVEVNELERMIKQDVALSYKLLRYINSPYFALRKEVSSIQQAIVLIGLKAIKVWATLIALSGINDKPDELIKTAMIRAKTCEKLAEAAELEGPEMFTVGLFSTLDAMLDLSMEDIVAALPLSVHIRDALLKGEGTMGAILNDVLAYERGEWEKISSPVNPQVLADGYMQSLTWAAETVQELRAG